MEGATLILRKKHSVRRFIAVAAGSAIAVCTVAALAAPPTALGGTLTLKVCGKWSPDQGPFRAHTPSLFGWDVQCGARANGLELWFGTGGGSARKGATAHWVAKAPKGITIRQATVSRLASHGVNNGRGWRAVLYWSNGHRTLPDNVGRCCNLYFHSSIFGWRLSCTAGPCARAATVDLGAIQLQARETRGPNVTPTGHPNLWDEGGKWIRGVWPVQLQATDPSGVCSASVALGTEVVRGQRATHNTDTWQQCPNRTWTAHVDATRAHGANGNRAGSMKLKLVANNAAGVSNSRSEMVRVDNSTPWIKLSGPKYALSTGRTHYVSAKAGGSPSGIARITCTIGRKKRSYRGSSAHVVVRGVGRHAITCTAQNNAINSSGHSARSRTATRSLTIRRPTALTATFASLNSARTSYRRTKHIPFGTRTKIGGRLTLKGGRGLAGQTVRVLTAPDNRSGHYSQVARARTGASGRWQVTLPVGPSRLIKAEYGGNSKNAPVTSRRAKVIVPARVKIVRLWPRRVQWGGTVHIRGRLKGGYLPPAPAGELVRLRLGYGRSYTTYGVKTDVTGGGRFSVTYKFGPGSSKIVRDYWFEECALPADDYPYAPACGRKITVRVGG